MRRVIAVSVFAAVLAIAVFPALAFTQDTPPAQKSALIEDEIILARGPGEHMEVRHIILKGTNEEIGYALGNIAQKDYGVILNKYAEAAYAKARLEYMRKNNPILLERMKGVARSYGVSLEDTLLDTSSLPAFFKPPQCSGILFPAAYSANGHTFYSASREYYLATLSEVMDKKPRPGEKKIFTETAVIEIYPDKGYSSLFVMAGDLTWGVDVVNSAGLSVSLYQDDTFGIPKVFRDSSRVTGLSMMQAIMLIANTCATLDEAKQVLLNNKILMQSVPLPIHMQVADKSGKAFIFAISPDDFSGKFVYNDGKPQPITNHGVYAYSDISKMPVDEKDPYDTFNRYRRLANFIAAHKGKYSIADGWKAMDLVMCGQAEGSEGGYHKIPMRTLYQIVIDNEERAIQVKFYLKDKSVDPVTGYAELIFSKTFEFKLRSTLDRK